MKKVLPLFLLILFCLSSFGQEKDKCMAFILLIDGELPTTTDITDGAIIFNDGAGVGSPEVRPEGLELTKKRLLTLNFKGHEKRKIHRASDCIGHKKAIGRNTG